jgi:copper/silver efflux system protein
MVTRIIELCAKNRFLVLLGVAFALAASLYSLRHTKLDAIPDLSDPQVIVFTEWMGRSPTLVEDQVTYPVVSSLVAAPHVTDVRGFSMFGMSFVYVIFEEGTDVYWARSRVSEYLSGIQGKLPAGVRPTLGPDATGIGWVFQYTLTDKTGKHGIDELRTFQDFTLRYALGSVPGVAEVASVGGYQKQYQVTVDPNKLRAYGLGIKEVIEAIRASNNDVGGRVVEMSGREYYVRGQGYIRDLGAIERIALRANGPAGVPVLIKDVGSVRFGPEIRRGLMEWNGEGEAVGAIVAMRYGENALDVIERVKAKVAELKPTFPEGVELHVAYDRSGLIERSIGTLKGALLEEAIVVSVVIVLFLLHLRSALLPILSLPVAVALAFIPMYLLDIPSTIMSLGGIAIAIGATVDAEIVMIEASHKKLEHAPPGADRQRLLAEAAREVTPAIFFSLLIIAVAFLPVFGLTGQAGRLFRPLAYTKTFVMLAAALLSITFAPALRDLLIRGRIFAEDRHPISRALIAAYRPFVYVALRRPISTVLIGVLALVSAVGLGRKIGSEFMPALNEGDLLYMPITFPNISIEEAKRQLQIQDRLLKSFPEVESVFGKVGRAETPTDPAPLTMVETTVRLKPQDRWRRVEQPRWYSSWAPGPLKALLRPIFPDQRVMSWDELTTEMNRQLQLPGWTNAWTMPIKTRVDMLTTGIRTPIGVKVFGTDLNEIERAGMALERVLTPIAGTRSVLYERNLGGLYLDILPNRDALARYGLQIGDVQQIIETAIGGAPITTTVEGRQRFSVNVRYPQDLRSDLDRLRQVLVPLDEAPSGAMPMEGETGALEPASGAGESRWLLAQAMPGMDSRDAPGLTAPRPAPPDVASDAAMPMLPSPAAAMPNTPRMTGGSPSMVGSRPGAPGAGPVTKRFIPLGQVADIKISGGPPMVRDEDGLLVGYVYVDIDQKQRDIGGYVAEAKAVVSKAMRAGDVKLPAGYFLKWTGQYEQLEEMAARMKILVPLTLAIIVVLLYLYFKSFAEVLIVLLSIPFALVGTVWLLWLLDYRLSTAVWIGVIALAGLAAQTGIIMIVYIDHALDERRRAGRLKNMADVIAAHMEGTVQRVRPKLMTVSTMLVGLLPLLWATGSGADVMKRIAAPMVGGLLTSAFLTLELIPVISTYWRREQLLWEQLEPLAPEQLRQLKLGRALVATSCAILVGLATATFFATVEAAVLARGGLGALLGLIAGAIVYFRARGPARRLVWPLGNDEPLSI